MSDTAPQKPCVKICLVSSVPMTLWFFYRRLIRLLLDSGFSVTVVSSDRPELHMLKEESGCSIIPLEISRQITPWLDILSLFRLVKIFKRNRFDLVHAHTPKAGLLSMIASRLIGVRCRVYTCHGLVLETESGLKRRLLAYAERTTCALAHRVLAVSSSLAGKLTAYEICSKLKLAVLGDGSACGIDLSRFAPTPELITKGGLIRRSHNISNDDTVIGFVGRLVPDKGVHILVESFVNLYELYPSSCLLIVGDFEPHRGKLPDETIRILRSHPGIVHLGLTYEIEEYYAAMDILVLPSRREGFGLSLIEAGALGIPTVATKVTGCIDAVVDGQTGLLVMPNDTTAITDALKRLLDCPKLRLQLGQKARERIENRFSAKSLSAAHVQLYHEMLGG